MKDFNLKADELLFQLRENAVWFEIKEAIKISPDADDDKFLELAIEASAGYVVTGNTNDFIIKIFSGVKISTPKEFYDERTQED